MSGIDKEKARKRDSENTADKNADDTAEISAEDTAENFAHASLRDLVKNAGAALGILDDEPPAKVEAQAPAAPETADEVEAEEPEAAPETPQMEVIASVNWTDDVADLEFKEDDIPIAQEQLETPASNPFEELARRVAETVSKNQEIISDEPAAPPLEAAVETGGEVSEDEASQDEVSEAPEDLSFLVSPTVQMDFLSEEPAAVEVAAEPASQPEAEPEPEAEFVETEQLTSVIESLLFSTDKPVSVATIKQVFKGTNVRSKDIVRALEILASDYAAPSRGVALEEVNGGYQLRTKSDNADFLRRLAKVRPFRLSGPALEVMAIVAYKQPVTKHEVDEIRGVESGHLLRALMERGLIAFEGKSDLPGKPMTYGSTRKFLETFGLRNLRELPTLSEVEELLPDGIGDVEEEKETLSDITDRMSQEVIAGSYSEGEEELLKINEQLKAVDTTSEFFEQEKQRERERRDRERAQDIRERLVLGEPVEEKDRRWLDRYEAKLLAPAAEAPMQEAAADAGPDLEPDRLGEALQALTQNLGVEDGEGAEMSDDNSDDHSDDLASDDMSEGFDETDLK